MKNLSRRAFLKLSGAALLAAGLTGTLTACGGGKDVEIPGTVNGIGYVSGKAGRTILGTNEYGIIHVVEVVVTLKNVSSRPVTLTADNFPAEIDNSASAPFTSVLPLMPVVKAGGLRATMSFSPTKKQPLS